jgi:hypothetical protein
MKDRVLLLLKNKQLILKELGRAPANLFQNKRFKNILFLIKPLRTLFHPLFKALPYLLNNHYHVVKINNPQSEA